ncbi:hypothetical protein [Planosporangium mesophilum]|uniref:Uncharacterized protein n=1 Tax=Planosporangium mesophilum TaxID=689768 RepID=A0A8J3X3F7_9ACTN|nr:hypothetical protein [Planosporangium mesophilum]NJC86831.1 hypothetical protein [Planosporangium mesophilum]GII26465.1 hypothetical protein Pme01_60620 [Planosporangium mesophilum]
MRLRSPQEKKALSYARDCRNVYGENDKSSRTSIRRRKRLPHRANRRHDRQTLTGCVGVPAPGLAEAVEVRLRGRRRASWRKCPDLPLGLVVKARRPK